jgi:hypothetical protein
MRSDKVRICCGSNASPVSTLWLPALTMTALLNLLRELGIRDGRGEVARPSWALWNCIIAGIWQEIRRRKFYIYCRWCRVRCGAGETAG